MSASAFPGTIEHKYGSTVISAEPTRMVTAGFRDSDHAVAFGVTPVGVRDFIGAFAEETRPWAQEALAGAEPEKVSGPDGALNFEVIAGLRPDLILAYSYLEEAEYDKLAKISPTVVEPQDGSLWREEPSDPRNGPFTWLGFELPEKTGEISQEQVELLDQDVIVTIGADPEAYQDDELFQGLQAVREGRVAYLGGFETDFAGALGFDSPLSLAAVDIVVPALAAALDGDPATVAS